MSTKTLKPHKLYRCEIIVVLHVLAEDADDASLIAWDNAEDIVQEFLPDPSPIMAREVKDLQELRNDMAEDSFPYRADDYGLKVKQTCSQILAEGEEVRTRMEAESKLQMKLFEEVTA